MFSSSFVGFTAGPKTETLFVQDGRPNPKLISGKIFNKRKCRVVMATCQITLHTYIRLIPAIFCFRDWSPQRKMALRRKRTWRTHRLSFGASDIEQSAVESARKKLVRHFSRVFAQREGKATHSQLSRRSRNAREERGGIWTEPSSEIIGRRGRGSKRDRANWDTKRKRQTDRQKESCLGSSKGGPSCTNGAHGRHRGTAEA